MIISLIVAFDENRGIGKNNRLPWHLASDLKRFKKLTMGHHMVMGRNTFESIGTSLPGRVMVVVTRQMDYLADGCSVVHSLDTALNLAEENHESEVFVIGGAEIFDQAIEIADKIYLTRVQAKVNVDVHFPEINLEHWSLSQRDTVSPTPDDEYLSEFIVLDRKDKKTVRRPMPPLN